MSAKNATIGALRVELGLNSAQFTTGLKQAETSLAKFGKGAGIAFAAVAAAGVAAGVALSKAMGSAVNRFDDIGKAAQRVGTTTEALSRLEYAAKLSDVSFEQLSTGLQRLSKNMADVATGTKGPAATAFSALGVSIKDATGQLRASDQVFADVAEKFARMEDGSTKTALAMSIFGRAGAEMIPLLNAGRDGLAQMADESDRFGNTVRDSAARNAEIFNDNLTRVQTALGGITNKITEAALPVLTYLSQKFVEAAGNGQLLESFAQGFVIVLKSVVTTAAVATTTIRVLGEGFATLMTAASLAATGIQNWGYAAQILSGGFAKLGEDVQATIEFINGLWAATEVAGGDGGGTPIAPFVADLNAFGTAADAAADAMQRLNEVQAEADDVFQATRTPLETLGMEIQRLDELLAQGMISWETYGRAAGAAMANAASTTLGALANLSAGLSGAFEDNKVLAVATAVLKGAEAVASAFASGNAIGGPLVGAAFAGAAAITAAANVAAVASVSQTSRSLPNSGAAPTVQTPAAPAASSGTAVNVTLKGGGFYSRDNIEELFGAINDALGDGFKLNLQGA